MKPHVHRYFVQKSLVAGHEIAPIIYHDLQNIQHKQGFMMTHNMGMMFLLFEPKQQLTLFSSGVDLITTSGNTYVHRQTRAGSG